MARYGLSQDERGLIEPPLPNKPQGAPRVDDRRVIDGIFHVLRTGSPWRDLPERYGVYTTVYNRFDRWAKAGASLHLRDAGDEIAAVAASDRQFDRPRSPACRGQKKGGRDHAIGCSRGRLSTKINALVDERGLPVRIVLSAGQASDKAAAPP